MLMRFSFVAMVFQPERVVGSHIGKPVFLAHRCMLILCTLHVYRRTTARVAQAKLM